MFPERRPPDGMFPERPQHTCERPSATFTEGLPHAYTSSDLAFLCAPGRIRTCDTRFRRAVLYPLSYGGGALGKTWMNTLSNRSSRLDKEGHRCGRPVTG